MLNNVVLVGRIVRTPELTQTQDGKGLCNLTLAVPRPFKTVATGDYETDFINVTLWEATAQNVVEYCGKGSIIGVRGRLVHRSYEIPDFKTIRTTEVVGDRVSFIQTRSSHPGAAKDVEPSTEPLAEIFFPETTEEEVAM